MNAWIWDLHETWLALDRYEPQMKQSFRTCMNEFSLNHVLLV